MMQDAKTRRILSRLGYYNYQERLIFRHLRQEGAWDSHLSNCRRFIMEAVEHFNPARITVLGSGWLLDFPLAEIIEKGIELHLVDIVHPPGVRAQVASFDKVSTEERDITGGLVRELWEKTRGYNFLWRLKSLEKINVPVFHLEEDPGLVISLNILSQLDFLPMRMIMKKGTIAQDEMMNFRRDIQQKHLDFLASYSFVLITDYIEVITDDSGSVLEEKTLFTGLPVHNRSEEWIWEFDHKHSDFFGKRSSYRVKALFS